jgi:hypothetical protein
MSIPIKHHHLPVFYLKRWVGDDGRLCQFSRPHLEVVAHRKYPSQTAYVERLYELPGLSLDKAQQIEQRFMQRVDSLAAEALWQRGQRGSTHGLGAREAVQRDEAVQ